MPCPPPVSAGRLNSFVGSDPAGHDRHDDVGDPLNPSVLTPRLEVRLPVESDRERFVELFRDDEFMAFSGGVHFPDDAHRRFDEMLVSLGVYTFDALHICCWRHDSHGMVPQVAASLPARHDQ